MRNNRCGILIFSDVHNAETDVQTFSIQLQLTSIFSSFNNGKQCCNSPDKDGNISGTDGTRSAHLHHSIKRYADTSSISANAIDVGDVGYQACPKSDTVLHCSNWSIHGSCWKAGASRFIIDLLKDNQTYSWIMMEYKASDFYLNLVSRSCKQLRQDY